MENIRTFFKMFHQLMVILKGKQKRQLGFILILTLFVAFFETLGVGAILPLIFALLQPDELKTYPLVNSIMVFLGINSVYGMVVVVGVGVMLTFVIKNIFVMWANRYTIVVSNEIERLLSTNMIKKYMEKDYEFFLTINSSRIIRGVTGDISSVSATIVAFKTVACEVLSVFMIAVFLFIISPLLAGGMLFLATLLALSIVLVMKKKISACGTETREAFIEREKIVHQIVGGVKEIKVMERGSFFEAIYAKAMSNAARLNTEYLWLQIIPGRITEVLFVCGLVTLILLSFAFSVDKVALLSQLSVLALSAVRVLPAISNVASAMNNLVFHRPGLENAYNNMMESYKQFERCEKETNHSYERKSFELLEANEITWRYKTSDVNVINRLSLSIHKGDSVGIIGESGAGKTTLGDLLLGLFTPDEGIIAVDGVSIHDCEVNWHRLVGYIPQSIYLLDDTIKNNILFGIPEGDCNEKRLWNAIEMAQLGEFIHKLPAGIDTELGERGVRISGGQRQRIAIARALYNDPELLIMDEATSALDNETEKAVIQAIEQLRGKKTLIIIAHRLSTIEKCDYIYEVVDGKVIDITEKWG